MEHFGDETDITTTFYVIDATNSSQHVIHVGLLSDDSAVFVLLLLGVSGGDGAVG